jgi:hypothetical protein
MGILRFTHRGINIIQELDKIIAAAIQLTIGQQDARIMVGDCADNQNPNEYQAETGSDPLLDGQPVEPRNCTMRENG